MNTNQNPKHGPGHSPALNGELRKVPHGPGIAVFASPARSAVPDVPQELLTPRETWSDPAAYDAAAKRIAHMFHENFAAYADGVSRAVRNAGPWTFRTPARSRSRRRVKADPPRYGRPTLGQQCEHAGDDDRADADVHELDRRREQPSTTSRIPITTSAPTGTDTPDIR
jgi:hypothetical protein